jgi:hypothetical protein
VITEKRCPSCGQTKPASDYGRNRSLGDGLSFYCLDCNRARSNRWYRENRRRMGKEVRDHSWIPEGFRWCPTCEQPVAHEDFTRSASTASGFGSRCRACDRAANSAGYFYRRYKLTQRQLTALRTAQQDRCAICGDPDPQHLDHDHSTGMIRKLLCQRCNQGLGLFRDDPYLLHVAGLYIEGHRQEQARETLAEAAGKRPDGASRPGRPPVGSDRRPGGRGTTSRGDGRSSRSARRDQAGEVSE